MKDEFLKILYDRGYSHAHYLPEVDSTNRALRTMAEEQAPQGTVVFAKKQTAGYGRFGRPFFSPEGSGLYFSLLLRPQEEFDPAKVTITAAVAVAEAVEQVLGLSLSVKWVNDLYFNGKKVAGILAQGATDESGRLAYCILGIGLNVYQPTQGFGALSAIADALLEEAPQETVLATLGATILDRFFALYQKDFSACLPLYRSRLFLLGKGVTVVQGETRFQGQVAGVDDLGALLVETARGLQAFGSGEIALEDYR